MRQLADSYFPPIIDIRALAVGQCQILKVGVMVSGFGTKLTHMHTPSSNLGNVLAQDKSPHKAGRLTRRTNAGSFSVEHDVKIPISILLFIFTMARPIRPLLEGNAFVKPRNNTTLHTRQGVSR